MMDSQSQDVGSEKPSDSSLSGNLAQDLRRFGLALESENIGAADGHTLIELGEIQSRMARGEFRKEDLEFYAVLVPKLLMEGILLRQRIDETRHEYLKLRLKGPKL